MRRNGRVRGNSHYSLHVLLAIQMECAHTQHRAGCA